MNTPEILEKIELHLLRIQRLLQQSTNSQLNAADAEKIHAELHEAYELSVILKYIQSTSFLSTMPHTPSIIESTPDSKDAHSTVEPMVHANEQQAIKSSSAKAPTTFVKESPAPIVPPPPTPAPELRKEPSIQTTTTIGNKVSFNDQKAHIVKEALADKLAFSKIADLKKAIALHEKFLFINELFHGDNVPYNEFIDKINQLQTFDEAMIIVNEYAATYNWDVASKTFQKMLIYIQRRHA